MFCQSSSTRGCGARASSRSAARVCPEAAIAIPAGGSPVAVLEPNQRLVYLCQQPALQVPRQEVLVIQKLLLEGDENQFWERANRVGPALGRGFGRRLLG
jgi:hypothetical protein